MSSDRVVLEKKVIVDSTGRKPDVPISVEALGERIKIDGFPTGRVVILVDQKPIDTEPRVAVEIWEMLGEALKQIGALHEAEANED